MEVTLCTLEEMDSVPLLRKTQSPLEISHV